MKVGIMQPYFFPYLGYWQLLAAVDKYVVYDDVTYIKGGWISRNNILLNGKKHLITLPLDNPSSYRKINEIEITNNEKAIDKLLRKIASAYQKAPHYDSVMPMLERLIKNNKTISMLNYNSIVEINEYLGIKTELILSSDLEKNNQLRAQDKVIHINKILGADEYYNAIGGKELYNIQDFNKEGISLHFLKMNDNVQYRQFEDPFVEGLSIIDVMMFNNIEKIQRLLKEYTLS